MSTHETPSQTSSQTSRRASGRQTLSGRNAVVTGSTSGIGAATAVALAAAARWVAALDGHVDILVHNAAVCPAVDTVSLSDADLETTLAVNLRAPHVLTAALVPAMAERGHGSVVVVGSWMATIGHPFVGMYSATKAAEAQLARSWAAEFGPRGVRVNTVAPGATRTPINDADAEVVAAMTASTPA